MGAFKINHGSTENEHKICDRTNAASRVRMRRIACGD
jgi:hypothetical protein